MSGPVRLLVGGKEKDAWAEEAEGLVTGRRGDGGGGEAGGAARDMGGRFAGGSTGSGEIKASVGDGNKMPDRDINTAIVLSSSTYVLTKLLTVDHDYGHVWAIAYSKRQGYLGFSEFVATMQVCSLIARLPHRRRRRHRDARLPTFPMPLAS
ncbi:hypothetical protein ABZP36_007697 [Zizania latifolia]